MSDENKRQTKYCSEDTILSSRRRVVNEWIVQCAEGLRVYDRQMGKQLRILQLELGRNNHASAALW